MLDTFIISPTRSMCLAHLIFLDFVAPIMSWSYGLLSFLMCSFLFCVFNRFLLGPAFYFQTFPILVLPSQRHTKLHALKEQVVWLLNDLKFDSSVILGEAVCKTSLTRFVLSRNTFIMVTFASPWNFCTTCWGYSWDKFTLSRMILKSR